jgi:hypothetical protein
VTRGRLDSPAAVSTIAQHAVNSPVMATVQEQLWSPVAIYVAAETPPGTRLALA